MKKLVLFGAGKIILKAKAEGLQEDVLEIVTQ